MEIKTVTTFVKIAELLNFTAAAAELGYSQAAVTAQVKQLEEELGVLLFDRLGRTVALTEAGRQAYEYFGSRLSPQIRAQADEWLRENGQKIREDREVTAVYEKMTSGVYEVRMSVRERGVTLFEVRMAVPDAASAEAVASKWEEKNTSVYQYLVENLF